MNLEIIVLAAGQGTRMKSSLPKVLHRLAGKAMLHHVLETADSLKPDEIYVVYGHGGELVKKEKYSGNVHLVEQSDQLGTGHAVSKVLSYLNDNSVVLILYGDVPLVKTETLAELVRNSERGLSLLSVHLDEPKGYGRIIRDVHGSVVKIVEEKDASETERQITEINTGILAIKAKALKNYCSRLNNNNAQGEYYLTDIIELSVKDGLPVIASHPGDEQEVAGVNSREQLAELESYYQLEQAQSLMRNGVTIYDPTRLDIRGILSTGRDVTLDINVVLEGNVEIGNDVSIGPGCIIKNSRIEDNVTIHAYSVIENATVSSNVEVGPFARIRPGSLIASNAKIGNFVEIKNSEIGKGSKVNHLSYIGDTSMGPDVNVGAGSITANYDGVNKHRTIIKEGASVGANSVMIAPVCVGQYATLGAGTILRKDAQGNELTISASKQITVKGWRRPTKKD
jgi:bifunctional UDP-N-acetylglucosamine pyrophosphorylase/glucosamine-1-phosphate N-acetyltransferase